MGAASRLELQTRSCIQVGVERPLWTVAAYHEIQQQRVDQPLWARVVPRVEELTLEPQRWDARIIDPAAYEAQMRLLIGLDPPAGRGTVSPGVATGRGDISTCPRCGAPLEATAGRYLSGVCLDEDRHIVAFETWSGNDADGFAWDLPGTRVYCADDCEVAWKPPRGVMGEGFDGATLDLTRLQANALEGLLTEAAESPAHTLRFAAKQIMRKLSRLGSDEGPPPPGAAG